MSLLENIRAIDLTDEKGMLASRVLVDLGVEVIKIEKPGGDDCRNSGPFYHDEEHPEKSLRWFALNRGKKSITLNLDDHEGKIILKKLVSKVHCLIESFNPGHMEQLGLGYSDLSRINPNLVFTSITFFGQTGPYKDFKAPDAVAMALGGYTWLNGYPDRAPVSFSIPQAYSMGSLQAIAATLMALYHAVVTGEGQHIDQSIVESIIWSTQETMVAWDLVRWSPMRQGMGRENISGGYIQYLYSCKDGAVSFHVIGGKAGARFMKALAKWMKSDGIDCKNLLEMDWEKFDLFYADNEQLEKIQVPIRQFFLKHTKKELYEEAIKRRIMLFPASTVKDLLENEHLSVRGFWKNIEHEDLGRSIIYPGSFYSTKDAGAPDFLRPPLLGEHNSEIYEGELGYSKRELAQLAKKQCI